MCAFLCWARSFAAKCVCVCEWECVSPRALAIVRSFGLSVRKRCMWGGWTGARKFLSNNKIFERRAHRRSLARQFTLASHIASSHIEIETETQTKTEIKNQSQAPNIGKSAYLLTCRAAVARSRARAPPKSKTVKIGLHGKRDWCYARWLLCSVYSLVVYVLSSARKAMLSILRFAFFFWLTLLVRYAVSLDRCVVLYALVRCTIPFDGV